MALKHFGTHLTDSRSWTWPIISKIWRSPKLCCLYILKISALKLDSSSSQLNITGICHPIFASSMHRFPLEFSSAGKETLRQLEIQHFQLISVSQWSETNLKICTTILQIGILQYKENTLLSYNDKIVFEMWVWPIIFQHTFILIEVLCYSFSMKHVLKRNSNPNIQLYISIDMSICL